MKIAFTIFALLMISFVTLDNFLTLLVFTFPSMICDTNPDLFVVFNIRWIDQWQVLSTLLDERQLSLLCTIQNVYLFCFVFNESISWFYKKEKKYFPQIVI